MLESGINATKEIIGADGPRMPLLALRSSPGKAGTLWTPWHDEFDLVGGKIRYYGDHRVDTQMQLGGTPGDRRLETTWRSHRAASEAVRRSAPPILVFRTVTGQTADGPHEKGFVEFVGLAVMTDLRVIEQRDAPTGRHFTNYVTELALLELGGGDATPSRTASPPGRGPAHAAPHPFSEGAAAISTARRPALRRLPTLASLARKPSTLKDSA